MTKVQPGTGLIKMNSSLMAAVIQQKRTRAMDAHCHLLEASVGMKASSYARAGAKDVIDPLDFKRNER